MEEFVKEYKDQGLSSCCISVRKLTLLKVYDRRRRYRHVAALHVQQQALSRALAYETTCARCAFVKSLVNQLDLFERSHISCVWVAVRS